MTIEEFTTAAEAGRPLPGEVPPLLRALWHDATGDWASAHRVAQEVETADGAWVHAYLHRKEGDPGNAAYWYQRAGRPPASGPFEDEWRVIARTLLEVPGTDQNA